MLEKIVNAMIAVAVCTAGGFVFTLLDAPLPWMLGALTAAAISAISGRRWFIPSQGRAFGRPMVGLLAGCAFTAEVLAAALGWWDAVLLVLVQGFVVTLLGYVFLRKVGGYDRQTAFYAGAPGGMSEMALMGASLGGDVRTIVVSHTLRIVVVLFSIPFILQMVVGHDFGRIIPSSMAETPPDAFDWAVLALCGIAGYGLARLTPKFPAGSMIYPLIFSACVHATGVTQALPPQWLVAAVQVILGGILGSRFAGIRWREMGPTVLVTGWWAICMVMLAAASAFVGTLLIDKQFASLILALAPGGTVEMTILTFSLGADVAFVATCQIVRILFVFIITPFLFGAIAPGRE
jgi:membrane AbrB-like protein